ncbi:hypothetical protein GCM10022416_53780 [Actinomadura keratinilytica]|uniref:Uncharacterized protein n=1 Tax=Actinomadura keratinilytica TaxID=547461 RepID=A0ABP7ZDF2_9ACTN
MCVATGSPGIQWSGVSDQSNDTRRGFITGCRSSTSVIALSSGTTEAGSVVTEVNRAPGAGSAQPGHKNRARGWHPGDRNRAGQEVTRWAPV